ncbi:MAG: PQQ-like beta-propeller repeat protein [Armatimonadetes bacterium]|nr:PQQ-like beta-propeller repeat protein [Armatimonadota bacterium]
MLTSEPAADGLANTLFDRVVTRWATVRWAGGTPVKLTLDLTETVPLAQIDFQTGPFGKYNTIPDPATYPAPRQVRAEFSDDGFGKNVRARELTFTSDCTFEGLHKGSVFPTLRWTCGGLTEKARQVRLTFSPEQWPGTLAMNELSVRRAGASAARVIGMIQRDVDGDGKAEIIAWSDQAELLVLRQDGTRVWRKQLPGYITAVECFPGMAPDGPRVLVTTREARLYCLKPTGEEVWKTDFLKSQAQNADLPTGYSIGLLKRADGRPLIVVGNYNLASFVEPDGTLAGDCRLPAAYQTMTLRRGFDFDGDGGEETISTEVWGVLSVLDTNLKRKAGAGLSRGKGLLLDYYLPPTPEQVKVVVGTETGVGMLDAKTLQYDWRQVISPINACVLGDLDGDGKPEIVVAKEDGYLLVVDGAGNVRQSRLVGEPVRDVAVVRGAGGPMVAAALPGRIVGLKPDLTGEAVLAAGDYTKLAAGEAPGVLLATGQGATISALSCGK